MKMTVKTKDLLPGDFILGYTYELSEDETRIHILPPLARYLLINKFCSDYLLLYEDTIIVKFLIREEWIILRTK